MQVDEPLVDAHLETVPGLRTLPTRCLPGGDAQSLQRTTNTGYQAEAHRSPFPFSTFMALLHSCPQCQSTLSSHYLFTLYRPQFSSTAFHHNFFSKKLFSVLICRKKKSDFPHLGSFLTLVGMRTGPFTLRFFSLAPLIKSAQTEKYKKKKKFQAWVVVFFLFVLSEDLEKLRWLGIAYRVITVIHV